MVDDLIEDKVERILREENPTGEAIKSLINIKPRLKGENSDVELKTDLSADEVVNHTRLNFIGNILERKRSVFADTNMLNNLIEIKERKAISKERKSRAEIVAISKAPDVISPVSDSMGILGKMFTSQNDQNKKVKE